MHFWPILCAFLVVSLIAGFLWCVAGALVRSLNNRPGLD